MSKIEFTMKVSVEETIWEWGEGGCSENRWYPSVEIESMSVVNDCRVYLSREAVIETLVDAFRAELEMRLS